MFDAVIDAACYFFADNRTHGAADKLKIHTVNGYVPAAHFAGCDRNGVFEVCLFLYRRDSVRILFPVGKVERVAAVKIFKQFFVIS